MTKTIHRQPRFVLDTDDKGRPIIHGGSGGGYVRGCRCEDCTEANRLRCKRRAEERRQLLLADPSLAPHGKDSTYTNWGCRCDECFLAHRERMQSERHKEIARESYQRRVQREKEEALVGPSLTQRVRERVRSWKA